MKVLCVDNTNVSLSITKGNWYRVCNEYDDAFTDQSIIVITDRNVASRLGRKLFKTIEQLREDNLNDVLDENK